MDDVMVPSGVDLLGWVKMRPSKKFASVHQLGYLSIPIDTYR
jgi:hypothetical protein